MSEAFALTAVLIVTISAVFLAASSATFLNSALAARLLIFEESIILTDNFLFSSIVNSSEVLLITLTSAPAAIPNKSFSDPS
jgi:hypothetical protein